MLATANCMRDKVADWVFKQHDNNSTPHLNQLRQQDDMLFRQGRRIGSPSARSNKEFCGLFLSPPPSSIRVSQRVQKHLHRAVVAAAQVYQRLQARQAALILLPGGLQDVVVRM